jgi:hypothetical protein
LTAKVLVCEKSLARLVVAVEADNRSGFLEIGALVSFDIRNESAAWRMPI